MSRDLTTVRIQRRLLQAEESGRQEAIGVLEER